MLFSTFGVVWVLLTLLKVPALTGTMKIAAPVLITLYILWLVSEAPVATSEADKGTTRRDRGTLELYAFGRIATVTAALALPTRWEAMGPVPGCGFILFILGAALRIHAIRTLGRFYSHRVRKVAEHRIIDFGPYRFVRHPAYAGMILAHIGFVIFFYHPAALALLALLFIPAVVIRILVEERMLFEIDGYEAYSKGRARLCPFLW